MARRLLIVGLAPIVAAVTFVGLFYFYYQGNYSPAPSVDIPFEQIDSPGVAPAPAADLGRVQNREGLLVIDALHKNAFTENEVVDLTSWIANRGYDVEIIGMSENGGLQLLEEKLRRADSFVVMLPQQAYSEAEADLVERFVDKGGKLLLVSDPTRPSQINALAKRFGLEFRPDYLYNTVEYDQNFRHIFPSGFPA